MYSLSKNLDQVFNTQGTFIIQSSRRDTFTYPNANQFRIDLPVLLNSIFDVTLVFYLGNQPAAATQALYISIDVFDNNKMYLPGYPTQQITFVVPTGLDAIKINYISQDKLNDICIFPKDYKPNISSLFITVRDDTGALVVNLPDFVMKLFINYFC